MNFRPLMVLALAGCAVGPDVPELDTELPANFSTAYSADLEETLWWRGFSDPTLNALMAEALAQNLTIAAADARLRSAEAFIRAERADLLPTVDGFVSGETVNSGGSTSEAAEAGLDGFWTIDLFGRRRNELAAARADAVNARAALADTKRLTAAALAAAYVELRRTDARIALLDQSLDLQQQTLRIVRLRAEAGLAADLDVQRAAGDLAQTRSQRGPLAASRAQADYTISVLRGAVPGTESVAPGETPTVPSYASGPAAGLPADLLRTRPDVRQAEAALVAETREIGAELADLYPSLNLTGLLTTRIDGSELAGDAVTRAGAVLDVPLLDFGRRRAEVRAARAQADEALAFYERTLLSAVADAENALIAIEAAEAQRADLETAVNASEIAFDQLQALYKEGLATLIDVLDAQRQLIASRERYVDSEARLAQAYVNLYAALGAPTAEAT